MDFKYLVSEVFAGEGLPELPIGRDDVPRGGPAVIAGFDTEGEGLPHQNRVGLPVLAPVPAHCHPVRLRPLHPHLLDVTGACHVRDQY